MSQDWGMRAVPLFGPQLRRWRQEVRRLSLRQLAPRVRYSASYLGKIEQGVRRADRELAERCDVELGAGGELLSAWQAENRVVLPAQLPAAPGRFVGRDTHLAAMDRSIEDGRAPGAPGLVVIDGPAGVGKTALALRWAHQRASRFPDGQLYADLGGFAPSAELPVRPGKVLEWFCTALGASSLPDSLDERASLYRTLLANRRVLVVLDNAANSHQVEPLLPASAGCVTIVTSRRVLSGLTVGADADRLAVGPLSEPDAVALVAQLIGSERAAAEPDDVTDLAQLCGYLPLALRIAAERVAAHPYQPIAPLVAEIGTVGRRLDELETGDSATVRSVFSWSYTDLSPEAASLFRRLGLHRGPHLSAPAAAALCGVPLPQVRRYLRELTEVHLLEGEPGDVYRMHDLLRAYALDLTGTEDDPVDRTAAVQRLTTWYLHTVWAAGRALTPQRMNPLQLIAAAPAVEPLSFDDHRDALDWCDAELQNFAPIVRMALDHGPTGAAWQLAVALWDYLEIRKPWGVWLQTHEGAQAAALLEGDLFGEGWVTTNLAEAMRLQGKLDLSQRMFDSALALRQRVGDRHGIAWTQAGSAFLAIDRGLIDTARDFAHRAHEAFVHFDDPEGQAAALLILGAVHRAGGHHNDASAVLTEALRLAEIVDIPGGRARIYAEIAKVDQARGELGEAVMMLDQAAKEYDRAADGWSTARMRTRRGDLLYQQGQLTQAHEDWTDALSYYEQARDRAGAAAITRRLTPGPPNPTANGAPAA
jgi:tetratricopeptide (TPR) repeat protein